MNLTRDYRHISASFDKPVSYRTVAYEVSDEDMYIKYEFEVGPLEYQAYFSGFRKEVDVAFGLSAINGSYKELQVYFSKLLKKNVALDEVLDIKSRILSRPTADLGVGNASEVFSTVLAMTREVVSKHPVDCLTFYATSNKKASVYLRLVKKYLGDWDIEQNTDREFKMCRKRVIT